MADGEIRIIEEDPVPGMPLGRHIHHDPRSRNFAAMALVPEGAVQVNKLWHRFCPPFDQLKLGSCTGNATAGICMTGHNYVPGRNLNENDAVSIYSLATHIDEYQGAYPPNDTGSNGLAAMKAAVQMKLLKGYRWAFGQGEALTVLSTVGPIIVGVNWYDSFDKPRYDGLVKISPGAHVRGGHEFEVLGVDFDKRQVRAVNSWGFTWGNGGRFSIGFDDFTRLLKESGDCACADLRPQPGT